MPEEKSLIDLFSMAHNELVRELRELSEPYDINRGELPVLATLLKNGDGISQKQLREDLVISKSTLSKTINSLNEKGYVRKERSDTDQRVRLIYLTENGEQMEDVIQEIDQAAIAKMMKGFDDGETEELLSYLDRLFQNLRE